jgi:hypothetical protein
MVAWCSWDRHRGMSGMGVAVLSGWLLACGSEAATTDDEIGESRKVDATLESAPETHATLRALFARHRLPLARPRSFARHPAAEEIEVTLASRANAGFSLRDRVSGVMVSVELVGARDVAIERSGDYALYRAGTADGSTLVHRLTAMGTEDYVELATAPADGSVSYDLRLGADVAGLRLVGRSLELLDASGTPRLHVAPPYLIDAEGERFSADLAIEGCSVDRDPRAPWGRAPVAPGADRCRLSVRFPANELRYPALLDPTWTGTGSLANARSGGRAVLLSTGDVLLAGGRDADGRALASAELYHPATRSWAATADLSVARAEHTLTLGPNGQAVAAGGRDEAEVLLASSEAYVPATGIWSALPNLNVARAGHRAVRLSSGDVLLAGGTSNAAEKLSAVSGRWNAAGTLLHPVNDHTLTLLPDGRALLVGGADAQHYNPSSNRWFPSPASHAEREGHSVTRLGNGRLLLLDDRVPSAQLFDPVGGNWSSTGALVVRRSGHSATLLADGRVLVAGGVAPDVPAYLAAEIYTPTWGTFAPGPAMLTARRDHVDVLLPNGRVLFAGGIDAEHDAVLDSSEEFEPRTLAATTSEYKFPATVDSKVLSDRPTELWASLTRPATLDPGKRYPLLVFLHGNHATCGYGSNPRVDDNCEYTDSGTCPSGYVVTPNHRGYDYLANELAGRGFVVVSINANRGINCGFGADGDGGLNLARGRLILRHLEMLSSWNRGAAGTPSSVGVNLRSALDFSQVGLLGHSRGGEGVRAAYEQYRDSGSPWPSRIVDPLAIRAVYEIGPVDGQTSRVLDATGTRWNVLLPVCDGDVSDLQGVKPFDRMQQNFSAANQGFKSTTTVWGANHNFYNTEWQQSDSFGCTDHRALFTPGATGSAEQRQTGMQSILGFFAANVGTQPIRELDDWFNPERRVAFDSRIERGYFPGPQASLSLEEFTRTTGTSSAGVRNTHSRVSVQHGELPEHDATLRGASVSWSAPGAATYFQVNFNNAGDGVDLRGYDLLDVRADRAHDRLNFEPSTDFEVVLVNADNSTSSAVAISQVGDTLSGPPGGPYENYHSMLTSFRFPLASFGSANLAAVRGVRFLFRKTPTGKIYLANLRATRSTLIGEAPMTSNLRTSGGPSASVPSSVSTSKAVPAPARITSGNGIVSLRTSSDGSAVELTLSSQTPFVARAQLLELEAGSLTSVSSRHPGGDLREVVFVVPKTAFDALPAGQPLSVRYSGQSGSVWDFGVLDKRALDR